MKRLLILLITTTLSVFILTGCGKPLENITENAVETQSTELLEQTPKEAEAQEKESVDNTTEKEKSASAETKIDTPTPENKTETEQLQTETTTNTNQQATNNSNEKLSMTDTEIQALLEKYDNIKTVEKVKEWLRKGYTQEDIEFLLQDMQADRAKNPDQQQAQTQTPPQNNTPKGTGGYGELMPEEDLDPNYVFGQSGQEGLSTTGHTY